jgi:hypothetical protein
MSNNTTANTPSTGDSANIPRSTETKKVYAHQLHRMWYQRRIRFTTLQVALGTLWGRATELERCEWRDVAQLYEGVLKLKGTTEFKHEDIVKCLEREGWQPKILNAVIERAEKEGAARILVSLARGV